MFSVNLRKVCSSASERFIRGVPSRPWFEAWDTGWGEKFSENGPNFQTISNTSFQGSEIFCSGAFASRLPPHHPSRAMLDFIRLEATPRSPSHPLVRRSQTPILTSSASIQPQLNPSRRAVINGGLSWIWLAQRTTGTVHETRWCDDAFTPLHPPWCSQEFNLFALTQASVGYILGRCFRQNLIDFLLSLLRDRVILEDQCMLALKVGPSFATVPLHMLTWASNEFFPGGPRGDFSKIFQGGGRPVARFQDLVGHNTFLGRLDFCFYYMFRTNFSGRNKIWGAQKKFRGTLPPTATGLGGKSAEICFFPLEIKKTTFFCWNFQNPRGAKAPLPTPMYTKFCVAQKEPEQSQISNTKKFKCNLRHYPHAVFLMSHTKPPSWFRTLCNFVCTLLHEIRIARVLAK